MLNINSETIKFYCCHVHYNIIIFQQILQISKELYRGPEFSYDRDRAINNIIRLLHDYITRAL